MGAILAAVIVMAVTGASLSLFHAHLEGVDEYNRRAAEVADAHRRAVHESVGVLAEPADGGSYAVSVANERADPVEIIEVRSVLENGTALRLPEFGGTIRLAGFGEASVPYDVPEGVTGSVRILAITRMGNTFGAEIGAHADEPDAARATVNGMGIGSRLAQAEYGGHVIYGSNSWGTVDSVRPHVKADGGTRDNAPRFAALLLDSEAETTVAISGYAAGTLVGVSGDGTLSHSTNPSILTLEESRGTATVAAAGGALTVSGPGKAMIRLDPAMFGRKVFLDATLGGGRVDVLTSPYGNLATPIGVEQVRERCPGLAWLYSGRPSDPAGVGTTAVSRGWSMDFVGLKAHIIHAGIAPALDLAPHTISYSKSGSLDERGLHVAYWQKVHGNRLKYYHPEPVSDAHTSTSHYLRYPLTSPNYQFNAHHGEFSIVYNSTSLEMPDSGLLLRDGSRAYVSYKPAMAPTMSVSQKSPPPSTLHHINDDTPVLVSRRWASFSQSDLFFANGRYPMYHHPHFVVSSGDSPNFMTTPSGELKRRGGDAFYGIPIMSFTKGALGNSDYVSLAEVTFNAIHPSATIPTYVKPKPGTPQLYPQAKFSLDREFCVISDRPYVVDRSLASDASALAITLPERDAQYARHLYLLVHARSDPITLRAVSGDSIGGLAPSVPYIMELEGKALHSGITSARGTVPFVEGVPGSFTLRLYPDSTSYRGAFSTIVFDPRAGESMRLAGEENRIYTVHTWAQVPVTGTVTVSDVEVRTRDGTGLRLGYLDGEYTAGAADGDRIWVPVIPGHFSIHMKVNGIDAALRYSDAVGGSSVRVIPASTSTVSRASFDAPIMSIGASAGTSAYTIASSDLPIVGIVSATMSGTAYIEHEHAARTVRTCMRDPLTGWVTAHKNGELVYESRRIVDYNPDITRSRTVSNEGFGVTRATFQYDRVAIDETVVVNDVSVGDFVEFHVHANIYAEHPFPSVQFRSWCGWGATTVHVSSEASATANIHGGSIIVG